LAQNEENLTCPNCGKNTLSQTTNADDVNLTQMYRCANCNSVFSQEQVEMTGMETTLEANNQDKPVNIPKWSPK